MAIDTNTNFVDALRQSGLLSVEQFSELRNLIARYPDSKALAGQLIQLGWLTPYQVNQLFQGQGNSLVLGQYRILERLGEGGMGQVFKARHQALGRIVALKVIRKDRLQNGEAVKRFRREMQMAGQLSHPNVVNAFDADAINGTHYFAMEFVDGIDLSRLVREKGPLPCHRACDCIRQAALGLQHAHEKAMVHRDIKPANLLVSKQPGTPGGIVIKILDMGLARFQATEQEDATMLSVDGHVIGTPDFMAPEQAKSSSTVDHRADIYSLGCTLYYLLAGKPPFTGGTNIEKLLKHQMDQPPPIEKLRPDVPEGVRLILRQMLAKKPEERVQTAGNVATALEPYCKPGSANADKLTARPNLPVAEPVSTSPHAQAPTFTSRGKRPTRSMTLRGSSRKRLIAIGAGAGVGLLGLFVLILVLASGGSSSPKTSPALASASIPPPPPPETRKTPPTDNKKPPVIDPAWRFLYPEATIVISFNLAQMRASGVYRNNEEHFKNLLLAFGVETDKFCDGLLLDAERVTVAFPPDDPKRLLLVFQGTLNAKKFKTYVSRGIPAFPVKDLPQVEFYDFSTDASNRWAGGFVTPGTFLLTTNPAYAVGGARRFLQNEQRVLRDTGMQTALEHLNDRATVSVVIGGQVSVSTPMQEKSTLQQTNQIKLIRGSIFLNDGVAVELHFSAVDAGAVELVESFPAAIKQSMQVANKDMAELFEAAFSERPTRGPGNTVTVRGRFNPKQVKRFFELIGRKD